MRYIAVIMAMVVLLFPCRVKAEYLSDAIGISASGMRAQSDRLRIVSQNIANADSTALTPGGDPYRRKTIFFAPKRDRKTGVETVVVKKYGIDPRPFQLQFDPTHPAADNAGYVKLPNVTTVIESQDAKEAQRSYEANLNVLDVSRGMLSRTIDILR